MKVILLSLLFVFSVSIIRAQERHYSTKNQEAIKYFALANQSLDDNLYNEAIDLLQKAIDEDSKFIEAHAVLADVLRGRWRWNDAAGQYQEVLKIDSEFNKTFYYKLGDCELHLAKYANAKAHLEKYLSYPDLTPQTQYIAKKLLADAKFSIEAIQHPVPFNPVNLGPEINTTDDEYMPAITADENTLIFTRKINNNEDFYQSVKVNGKWQKATYLSNQINTPQYNEGSQSLSLNGKVLFFTGCNRPDGLGRCDIYISIKKGDEWGKPFDIAPPINTPGWESQPSISADGRTLYFVSNRKGGFGGYDIWKSNLTEKGWAEPENLGPNINTAFDEQSPFIHADDSTLYFCSNGWPGLGGMDLFVSRLGKDGKWQKPTNLGYPINSNGDENGLTTTAGGNYAFFASNKLNGYGGFDIYTFELPLALRPHQVTYVKGTVLDANTKKPLEASVDIVDLEKNNPVYQDYSSEDEGYFLATITTGKDYALNIARDGYLFYSGNFSLKGLENKDPFNITVNLQPIEIGSKVILQNIFFATNKFDLQDESRSELQKLIDFMTQNSKLRIEISGHTDNKGTVQSNQVLSENRAKAVYQYLVAYGIGAERLSFKGYGQTQPISSNDTEDGRSKNRRTEFKIVAK